MIQRLTERYIINLMQEEWSNKVQSLLVEKKSKSSRKIEKGKRRVEDFVDVDGDGRSEMIISPGLKVTSKSGPMKGTDYEVVNVHGDKVVLSRTDIHGMTKKHITITIDDLKSNYTM